MKKPNFNLLGKEVYILEIYRSNPNDVNDFRITITNKAVIYKIELYTFTNTWQYFYTILNKIGSDLYNHRDGRTEIENIFLDFEVVQERASIFFNNLEKEKKQYKHFFICQKCENKVYETNEDNGCPYCRYIHPLDKR